MRTVAVYKIGSLDGANIMNIVNGYTKVKINIIDKEKIEFGNRVVSSSEYINAIVEFLFTEKKYIVNILEKFKGVAPIELVKRIEDNLFVYKVYIAYVIFTHISGIDLELKEFYKNNLIEQIEIRLNNEDKIKSKKTRSDSCAETESFKKILGFYCQDNCVIVNNLYQRAQRRFLYLIEFEYISGSSDISLFDTFDEIKGNYLKWDVNILKKIEYDLHNILDFEICSIEEYMDYPLNKNGVLASADGNHISNMFKWERIADKLIKVIRSNFDKVTIFKDDNLYFETDWDKDEILKKQFFEGIDDFVKSDEYDLWSSQILTRTSNNVCDISYYETYGDLHIHLRIMEKSRTMAILNPFMSKRKKLIIYAMVGIFNNPHLLANDKLERQYGKDTVRLICAKKNF